MHFKGPVCNIQRNNEDLTQMASTSMVSPGFQKAEVLSVLKHLLSHIDLLQINLELEEEALYIVN